MNFPQQIDSAHDRGLESEESGSDCFPKGESLGMAVPVLSWVTNTWGNLFRIFVAPSLPCLAFH